MEEELTDKQIAERDELIESLEKEDLFAKRKYASLSSAFSGFLIVTFIATFLSTISYWSGAITDIDVRLISFCLVSGILMAPIEYRYNIGATYQAAIFLLIIFVSWLLHYGYRYLFI